MNRAFALLLALIGGAAAALAVVMAATILLWGVLWLFVFGDSPWPAWVEMSLNIAIPLIGLVLWGVFALVIWRRLAAFRPTS